jgi:hypothetical protein
MSLVGRTASRAAVSFCATVSSERFLFTNPVALHGLASDPRTGLFDIFFRRRARCCRGRRETAVGVRRPNWRGSRATRFVFLLHAEARNADDATPDMRSGESVRRLKISGGHPPLTRQAPKTAPCIVPVDLHDPPSIHDLRSSGFGIRHANNSDSMRPCAGAPGPVANQPAQIIGHAKAVLNPGRFVYGPCRSDGSP